MSARPTWKGVLQISLVSIPIKVFPATESSATLSFNQLHSACQTRVTQKRWCASCAREVPSAEIVKGFEFEPGRYVLLLDAELDAVQPASTRVIDLVQFASAATLPLWAIDRAYYLAPDGPDPGPAADAYALLVEAMHGKQTRTGTVGIGTLAIYGREYVVAVTPQQGTLLLYTLHHAGELRAAPYVAAPSLRAGAAARLNSAEVRLARQVIAALMRPLTLDAFPDQYQIDLRRLITAKIAGEEIVVPRRPDTPAVGNLHDALTRSLHAMKDARV